MPPVSIQEVEFEEASPEVFPLNDAAFISIRDVHGFSVEPILLPRSASTIVAYTMGPFLVAWDWKADRKTVFRQHRHCITCLAFNSTGTMIASADGDRLVLWDVPSWTVMATAMLPKGKSEPWKETDNGRPREFEVCRAGFLAGGKLLATLERSKELMAVQCLRTWLIDGEKMRALAEVHISQDCVHGLRTRPETGGIYLCSNGLVSSWTCLDKAGGARSGSIIRGWSFPCEDAAEIFVGAEVASSMGWVLVVESDGSVHVVSDLGERLRRVRRDGALFTSCCMDGGDCLLVGTARGTVLWFNVPSMDVWRRLPYDMDLRDSMQARPAHDLQGNKTSSGPLEPLLSGTAGVRADFLDAHAGFCVRTTADKTVSVMDLASGSVCNALFTHLAQVTCLTSTTSARRSGMCLYTGSLDETLGMWELDQAKDVGCSQQRFLDIASHVDPTLTHRRGLATPRTLSTPYVELSKLTPSPALHVLDAGGVGAAAATAWFGGAEQSRGVVSVRSVAVDATAQLLACGTSHGCCLVHDLRTCRTRAMVDVCRQPVAGLAFVAGGKYLIARSAQGWVWVLDQLGGFKKSLVVQEPTGVRNSASYWQCHDVHVVGELSPVDAPAAVLHTFHVITLLEPRTIAVYKVKGDQVTPYGRRLDPVAKIPLRAAPLCIALHPSHHYVYTMSEEGLVEVNHLNSGTPTRGGLMAIAPEEDKEQVQGVGLRGNDLRAREKKPQQVRGVCVACDASGLFMATVTLDQASGTCTLILWEAATGEFIDMMGSLPLVSCITFTQDSVSLFAGCVGGAVLQFNLGPELSRDARFVILGGPADMPEDDQDEEKSSGGLYTRRKKGEASSGFDRYQRMSMVPDVVSRALAGTSARSLHALWADKPVQLPPLPKA